MKFMNFLRLIFGCLLICIGIGHAEKLKIGSAGILPPFSGTDEQGNLYGFEIEIAKIFCQEIKSECEFIKLEFKDLLPALNEKRIDMAISALSVIDIRLQVADAARIYMTTGGYILKLKSNNLEFSSGSLANKKIGVVNKTVFHDCIKSNYANNLVIVEYVNREENIQGLFSGEVDFIFDDATYLEIYHLNKPNSQVQVLGPKINNPKWFGDGRSAYFSKEDAHLREKFNKTIAKLRANYKFQELSKKYFNKDIAKY